MNHLTCSTHSSCLSVLEQVNQSTGSMASENERKKRNVHVISHSRFINPHQWMRLAGQWFISNVPTVREWKQRSVSNTDGEDKARFASADKSGSDVQGKDLLFQICFCVRFPTLFLFSSHQPPCRCLSSTWVYICGHLHANPSECEASWETCLHFPATLCTRVCLIYIFAVFVSLSAKSIFFPVFFTETVLAASFLSLSPSAFPAHIHPSLRCLCLFWAFCRILLFLSPSLTTLSLSLEAITVKMQDGSFPYCLCSPAPLVFSMLPLL